MGTMLLILGTCALFVFASNPTEACSDKYPTHCPGWASRGYCTSDRYKKWMSQYCQKTCNVCTGATTAAPATTAGPIKTHQPVTGSCGVPDIKQGRVIAGVNALKGAWPWQILMLFNGRPGCGGSLISPTWVVTAAHCVSGRSASIFKIRVGEHITSTTSDGQHEDIQVSQIISHPSYSRSTLDADIALMKLSKPVTFGKYVKPVCLPKQGQHVPVGTQCYITGWGKIKHPGNMHHTLQQGKMPVVSKTTCTNLNTRNFRIKITDNMVCAGHGGTTRVSGCHGDSGGPFVCQTGANGRWVLHGAVSWGSGRCDASQGYTVFARIAEYRSWIDQHVGSTVVTTRAPVVTTKAPVVTTKAPVVTTKAPVVTTGSSSCVDQYQGCSDWASKGHCTADKYKDFMAKNCKVSCSLCGGSGASTAGPASTAAPATTVAPVKTTQPAKGSCGVPDIKQGRVIAGVNALKGAWPWQILMLNNGRPMCGGSLVSPTWVVTAAHCVSGRSASSFKIRVGEHITSTTSDGQHEDIQVSQIISHPSYSRSTIDSDIALMRLAKPVTFGKYVKPVCLPKQDQHVPVGTQCYITGWGKIKHPGNMHHTLQQGKMPVVSKTTCTNLNTGNFGIKITDNMVCAGHGGSTRVSGCHGDSGGPFVCQTGANGQWVLHGAVSWGSGRCDATQGYTVFARMAAFRSWIDQEMSKTSIATTSAPVVTDASCSDKYPTRCPGWAGAGLCTSDKYKTWMSQNCKKSCNLCSGSGATTAAPVTTAPPATTATPVTTAAPATTVAPVKTQKPVTGSCGVPDIKQGRVIAGVNALKGAWPWQILMLFNGRPGCGGSLISPTWVVTAAHCVSGRSASTFKIRVGEHITSSTSDGQHEDIQVSQIISHPRYSRSTLDADIALMRLAKPATFGKYVKPVCLPNQGQHVPVGTQCYITGWGKIKHPGNMHHTLQQGKMPVVSKTTCANLNTRNLRIKITDNMVCAGHGGTTRVSGCHGDSGGPFVCQTGANGQWVLHGAVSWGSGRCDATQGYTVFARIAEFRSWIDQEMSKAPVATTSPPVTNGACSDKYTSCSGWAKRGLCTDDRYKKFMSQNCKKSCNICSVATTTTTRRPVVTTDASCSDKYPTRCPSWVNAGLCTSDKYKTWMSQNCKKSCSLCSGSSVTTAGPIKTQQPVTGNCGKPDIKQGRVIAGVNALKGAWPWQILMLFNGRPGCGGSLISPTWVVTAAHCVSGRSASIFKVRVGEHITSTSSDGQHEDIQVSKIISHPSYSRSTIDSDIALMKLSKPVTFGKYVKPVCLPKQDQHVPVGTQCYITGWGKIRHPGNMHHTLQQGKMPVVSKTTCTNLNTRNFGIRITDNMVCAGHGGATKVSGCHGDSGGPFVCQTGANGQWVLHGAVSWGSGRCDATQGYSVFARVAKFRSWIDQQMQRN